MPTFDYVALDSKQKTRKGSVEATSSQEAIAKIKEQGFQPTQVTQQAAKKQAEEAPKKKKRKGGGFSIGRVSTKHLTVFTRQLSTLQDAGLPLLRSLQILEEQQKPGKLKNVLQGVCEEVEGGTSLSEAMAKYPAAFDKLYTKMVAAGEIGGVLDVILQRLSDFLEKAARLKRKIIGAMVYPVVVITVAIGIVMFIMIWIIPQFSKIFLEFGVKMPWLTDILIYTSQGIAGTLPRQPLGMPWWIPILLSPFILYFGLKVFRKLNFGRALTDSILLFTPVIGGLIRKSVIAKFTRTLGTLINAGVPILEAISITRDTCGNYVFERALQKVHDSIREGETFAVPLRDAKVCDSIVVNMIDVGEETGDLDSMLMKIADNYDDEVDVAVNSLVKLIEPMMVLVLGVLIGGIVIAMFLPLIAIIEKLNSGGGV